MRRLRLVGLSGDGRDVVFVDEANNECAAPADDRLRAALRGDRARLGQLEIEMDSVLRPRDIQARIRAGQTPDSVAALAQVSVDKIMLGQCEQTITETARRLLPAQLELADDDMADWWRQRWSYSRVTTIYGGASEVQHDLVAERLLGLPRGR